MRQNEWIAPRMTERMNGWTDRLLTGLSENCQLSVALNCQARLDTGLRIYNCVKFETKNVFLWDKI